MPQEILLYGLIWDGSVSNFIKEINEADPNEPLTVRINSGGGSVSSGWGMVAKFNEYAGQKSVKIDGLAASMAAFYAVYCDDVECLDVSEFMFHRASFGDYYEQNYMTEAEKDQLAVVNSSLEKAFRAKIDVEKFENLKSIKKNGVTVKSLFSTGSNQEVWLTPSEAKQIGLVNKITAITPSKKAEIQANYNKSIAANYTGGKNQNTNNFNPSKMTKEDFKREHPEAYAAIVNEGVTAERDRCGAYLAYITADKDAVIAGIKSGEQMSATTQAELNIKIVQAMNSNPPKLDADGKPIVVAVIPPVETPATPPTPTAKTQLDKVRELLAPKKSA